MDKLFSAASFIKYRLKADTAHDIHSPFVFDLFNNILYDKTPYYCFDLVESIRAKQLLNNNKINIKDFGTGKNQRTVRVSDIAKKAVKPKKYAQLLFRLVNRFSSANILEIGTSLGITTLYLSMPNTNNRIITLEGSGEIAAIAKNNFEIIQRNNIELISGEFGESLPKALLKFKKLDFVYFDGNHKQNPTLSYFDKCLDLSTEDSIFVFDDIYWSREMKNTWKEIKKNPKVTLSIDLFQFGIVFFKKGLEKQHFTLRY